MSEALRLDEEDERTSGILRMQPRYAPELRRLQAENETLRQKVFDLRFNLQKIRDHIQADCL